jgi:hypothetical protein
MKRPYDLVTNTWRQSFTCDNYFSDSDLMLATLIFCAGMCRTELHRQCRTHVRVVRPRMACAGQAAEGWHIMNLIGLHRIQIVKTGKDYLPADVFRVLNVGIVAWLCMRSCLLPATCV